MSETIDLNKLKDELKSIGFQESVYPVYMVQSYSYYSKLCSIVNIPEKYGDYPVLPPTSDSSFFRPATLDVILMYFKGLTMDLSIYEINGLRPATSTSYNIKCDYCDTHIDYKSRTTGQPATLNGKSLYHCQTCYKDMCPLCHSETNIHIAFKHKANLAKFQKRLPKVLECINNHDLIYVPEISGGCSCDICGESIELFNSNNTENTDIGLHTFGKEKIRWYMNRQIDYDMCLGCARKPENQITIKEKELKMKIYYPICSFMDFGSLLDWIPIYVSNSSDFILCNLNPESKHYKKLAYCMNDDDFSIYYLDDRYRVDNEMEIEKMDARIQECISYDRTLETFNLNYVKKRNE